MAEKPLISNSQKPRSVNPALMQSQLDQARKRNQQSLNQIRQQQLGNQVELDKIKQQQLRTKRANERSLTGVDLYRQNNPINDPRAIENTLNQQRETARENPNQDQEEINGPKNAQNFNQVENYNSQNAVGADREAGEQSREARIGELKTGTKEKEIPSSPEITAENQTPQNQENNLAEKKQSQNGQTNNIPNIPGMKSLTGGIDPNDSPEEIAKKGIKMAAKKAMISILLWASPFIISGLAIALLLAFILIPTVMVYNCYQQMGYLEKGSFLWSAFWGDFGGTLKKAMSSDCFAEDTAVIQPETAEPVTDFDNLTAPSTVDDPMPGPSQGTPVNEGHFDSIPSATTF